MDIITKIPDKIKNKGQKKIKLFFSGQLSSSKNISGIKKNDPTKFSCTLSVNFLFLTISNLMYIIFQLKSIT